MYGFIDTNEYAYDLLPTEALKLNGEYIENLIDGYRTLHVSGREALSPEIETLETGVRDGSKLKSKRYPARLIVVTYQLIAENETAFRAAYNKLGGILDVTDAEMIFNDEPDKFFIGTPSAIGEVEAGRNAVVGSIEFLCVDPFKYSVKEYVAELQDGSAFVVDYNGTHKAFPVLESTFKGESENGSEDTTLTDYGDCDFVAFSSDNGSTIQLGAPENLDGTTAEKSQTMMNQLFAHETSWGSTAKALWSVNTGLTMPHSESQVGAVGMVNADAEKNYWFMSATDYGSGGASITRQIGTDSAGETGASDFVFTFKHKNCPSNTATGKNEVGIFYALLVSGTGDNRKILAGIRFAKYSVGNSAGKINFYVNGTMVKEIAVDATWNNPYFGTNGRQISTITKMGNTVSFNIGGLQEAFKWYDSTFADEKAVEVTFMFARYPDAEPLAFNGVLSAKFVKTKVKGKFTANDVVQADCSTGDITLNGLAAPEYGQLGNDWETFYLHRGTNRIGVSYSAWLTGDYIPDMKLKYREVFL